MTKITIEVMHNGGQIRAYGPSVYEAIITLEPEHPFKDEDIERFWALEYFRRAVCNYYSIENPPTSSVLLRVQERRTHRTQQVESTSGETLR